MIRAYHVIMTTYDFWLPNDPRGSWSNWVRQWELYAFGAATKVETRRSVAKQPHDRQRRMEAKKALQYPEVHFDGRQALAVGHGFRRAITDSGYVIHACSILPQHAHLIIARCNRRAEQIVAHLKGRATQQLSAEGLHPLAGFQQSNGTIPSPGRERVGRCFWKATDAFSMPSTTWRKIRRGRENRRNGGRS